MLSTKKLVVKPLVFAFAVTMMALFLPYTPPVAANHPENTCLDVEPETDSNPTGTQHTVTATLRKTVPTDPITTDPCEEAQTATAGTGTVMIRFEITGPGDPNDDGNTPTTPDRSCQIAENTSTCSISYSSQEAGQDEIRGWIDHDKSTATVEADLAEGQPEQTAPGTGCTTEPTPEPDCTDVVTKTWTASRLDCEPESDRNASGSSHTVTCTATDEAGNPVEGTQVDAEATGAGDDDAGNTGPPDYSCTTDAQGQCSFTDTSNKAGTTTYRAWIDDDGDDTNVDEGDTTEDPAGTGATAEPDDTDAVSKEWGAARVDCEPETDTNPSGSSHTVTCTATDANGDPVEGEQIDVEATGANDPDNGDSPESPDFSCTTDATGQCSFTHSSGTGSTGTTTYRAWTDTDESNQTTEADAAETQADTDTDNTDVVTKTWGATGLDCQPETDNNPQGSSHTVTCTATDANGDPAPNQQIDVEATGANDPDDSDSPESPDFTCTTDAQGQCTFTHDPSDPGGTGESGTTAYRAWIDRDQSDTTTEADTTEGPDEAAAPGATTEPDDTDVVTKNWTVPSRIDCDDERGEFPQSERETNASGGANSNETYTCRVTDEFGNPFPNETVRGENENGVNDPDAVDGTSYGSPDYQCTTDADGECTITVTQADGEPGTGHICFWHEDADPNTQCGANEPTEEPESNDAADSVDKTWGDANIDCRPETDVNPSGTSHTVTCRATDDDGNPIEGQQIDAEATGAGDPDNGYSPGSPDFTCTTDASGECSFQHTSNDAGTTTYRAWADDDDDNSTTEADPIEGQDETVEAGTTPEGTSGDNTDVVTKQWGAARVNCEPETATNAAGDTHTVTCTATDANGNPVEGAEIDTEETGAGDADGNTPESPDRTCTTGPNGQCTFQDTHTGTGTTTYRSWVDSDNDDTTTEADAAEGADEAATPGDTAEPDDTDVTTKQWAAGAATRLDCEPEADTNTAGDSHTVTCTATDANGNPVEGANVDAERTGAGDADGNTPESPDETCTTDAQGQCTFTDSSTQSGTTTYRAWVDSDNDDTTTEADAAEGADEAATPGDTAEPDDTDVTTKQWNAGPAESLDCEPETDTNNAGDTHTVTCTARDANGNPSPNQNVDVEMTGANDPDNGDSPESPDRTCTTDNNGQCTFTHTGNEPGTTTYRAWVDSDNDNTTTEADADEPRDETTEGTAGLPPELGGPDDPDTTDVVEKTWVVGPASRLDCEPETAQNTVTEDDSHTVTCTVTDAGGNPIEGAHVDSEASGANDPDNADGGSPDFSCGPTDAQGQCSFTHSGAQESGTTTYRSWIDSDNDNSTNEADATEGANEGTTEGGTAEPDNTDVTTKQWNAGPGTQIDCQPETAQNDLPGDSSHTVTCTVTDDNGNPVQGAHVDSEASGANDPDNADGGSPDFSCGPTDAQGQCSFTHSGAQEPGTTTYRSWIDADNDNSTNEADPNEAGDEAARCVSNPLAAGCDEPDNTDVTTKQWTAAPTPRLDCEPETDTNTAGDSHTVTCTATDADGNPIEGANVDTEETGAGDADGNTPTSPDHTCTTGANGQCTFTDSSTQSGTTTYRSWIDSDNNNANSEADASEGQDSTAAPGGTAEPDATDVTTKQWNAGPAARLDCEPETDTNPVGSQHTVTCTARDANGNAVQGANVDAERTGAGDTDGNSPTSPDHTCNTNASGQCSFSHTSNDTGTTTYRAWIDSDNDNTSSEADATEGQNEANSPGGTGEGAGGDNTDVVTKEWTPAQTQPQATRLDCAPETDTNPVGSQHTITCTARDSNGNPVQGVNVDAERIGAGDTDGDSPTSPDHTCTTEFNGQCSFSHTSTAAGTTTYRAWVDADGQNSTNEGDVTEGQNEVNQPGGTSEGAAGDNTDVVTKQWTSVQATRLDCEPETSTGPTGSTHTVTCVARDANGNVVQGANVDVEANGTNDPDGAGSPTTPDFTCTTDAQGQCSFQHFGSQAGETTYRSWIDSDNNNGSIEADAFEGQAESSTPGGTAESDGTDVTTRTWTGPTASPTPSASASPTPPATQTVTQTPPATTPGASERTVTLESSKGTKTFGKQVLLSGGISSANPACVGGQPVVLRRTVVGDSTSTVFTTVTTNADGTYSHSFDADVSANYIAHVDATAACGEANSNPSPILVKVAVNLRLSRQSVRRGGTIRLTGTVAPCGDHASTRLALFQVTRNGFSRVDTARLDNDCTAVWTREIRSDTAFQVRWAKQDEDHLGGRSRSKAVSARRG